MRTAGLYALPDPDPEDGPAEPVDDPTSSAAELVDEDPGEPAVDEDAAAPRTRALAIPDLRPYADVTWIPDVINAGAAAVRRAPAAARRIHKERKSRRAEQAPAGEQQHAGRLLLQIAVEVAAGAGILLRGLGAWLGGKGGPAQMSNPARLLATGVGAYFIDRATEAAPAGTPLVLGGAFLAGALRARAHATKAAAKAKQTPPEPPAAAPAKKRRGLLRRRSAPVAAVGLAAEPAATLATGPAEGPVSTPATLPAEPPLIALLRTEIGAENGVHLTDLRPAMRAQLPGLSEASDGALRQVLVEAGFDPTRKFRARGSAGRAGVHRDDLPPLPSPGAPPGALSAPLSSPGEPPRPANSPQAESAGEGSGERRERDFDVVEDPERGPSYSRVVHHDERTDH